MILVFLINLIVGALVGVSGIAGFLLPIFYISVLHLDTSEALAMSFAAFIVSGVFGSFNYARKKLLNFKLAGVMSIGSFLASFLGVKANLLISPRIVMLILYGVVFFAGLSILFRKDKPRTDSHYNQPLLVVIGFVTGFICAVTGAGGPIIVLPILIILGIEVHEAVGIALFNSIFIGIPAVIGYLNHSNSQAILWLLPVALIAHGIGVWFGSRNGDRVNQRLLKSAIAIFSISIAAYKLLGGLL
ncbi:sulfite exporter TauE/SafE family protein [Loigolactobacillus jiayinensis]|uniref:Probable membrane transporter protein n=1 Tax=Loigolactobacillus jiayinensis TaxID=2486016 RepID=A0ABW1RDN7_9LACO|nr:sulfite exporter TauE/SafE family protein [Loigolactobacillus jiayinensis]